MGVDKKTTLMLIKVDLQCCRCYKKIKKVLCRIPQIQDQVYNEKENCVLIKVVCCSPENIKQKIICKGGCAVKSIEIIEKPTEPVKPKEKPTPEDKGPKGPKGPETTKKPDKPKEPEEPDKPKEPEKPKGSGKLKVNPKEPEKLEEKPKETPPPPQCPPPHCPPRLAYPEFRTCCTECYEGRSGGPCYSGHGRPPASYDGYYGRPIYDSFGGGGGYRSSYVSQCDNFGEENSSGCSIM